MRVLITRPRADAAPLAARLAELGHEARILPLLEIVRRENVRIPDLAYQCICVTSANAVAALGKSSQSLWHLPLYSVGPQSAAAAQQAGFRSVEAHGGNVDGLVAFLTQRLSTRAGPVLYLSGAETSGDLEGQLTRSGFTVERVIAYDAVAQTPEGLGDAIRWAEGVLLYSPRTALLWAAEIARAGHDVSHLQYFCLSANVAMRLPQSWRIVIAKSPDESAVLASLAQAGEGH